MTTSIASSLDLATVLNATPLTEADAAETPRDWLAGIWVAGSVYPLDPQATTDTLAALADGTAAVSWSPKGKHCNGRHRVGVEYDAAHWCDADTDSWTWGQSVRGVDRDWRSVNVWDANGHSETKTYPTLDEAKAAFDREVADLRTGSAPQVDEDTILGLLAQEAGTALYVSFATGSPELYLLTGDDVREEDTEVVISRADLVGELGDGPDSAAMTAYLPELQDLVDEATQQL